MITKINVIDEKMKYVTINKYFFVTEQIVSNITNYHVTQYSCIVILKYYKG
mgnify:CR=1 FL=1